VRLPLEYRFEQKEVYIRRDAATGDVSESHLPASHPGTGKTAQPHPAHHP